MLSDGMVAVRVERTMLVRDVQEYVLNVPASMLDEYGEPLSPGELDELVCGPHSVLVSTRTEGVDDDDLSLNVTIINPEEGTA